jgi:hypothetical protein
MQCEEKWREDEEEDVRIYCMILRKREATVNWKKHYITLCRELALEEAMDLAQEGRQKWMQ